jgi:hypothetical protein
MTEPKRTRFDFDHILIVFAALVVVVGVFAALAVIGVDVSLHILEQSIGFLVAGLLALARAARRGE